MQHPRCFLVIADDHDRLALITSTLHRKFPNSVIQICRESEAALTVTREHALDAIIAVRASDMDGLPLVEALRASTPIPIVLMSGAQHAAKAKQSGASRFLHTDEWLLIGAVVGELLGAQTADAD